MVHAVASVTVVPGSDGIDVEEPSVVFHPPNRFEVVAPLPTIETQGAKAFSPRDAKLIGTPLIGAAVAQVGFWVLLTLGLACGDVGKARALVFVGLWIAGLVWLPRIAWWTAPLAASWVAVLDIVLVFTVFRGDVRVG